MFKAMSANQFHVGGIGQGLACKLVNNMLIQVNTVAIAEAFVMGAKAGLDPARLRSEQTRVDVVPFDSGRRYMAILHRTGDGRAVVYVKGAVERVLGMAADQVAADGAIEPLDETGLLARAELMAAGALRVLAFARLELPTEVTALSEDMFEGRLTVLGLQGMYDPPRPDALAAVATCREAGVAVKMITGDHAATAAAIADRFGLGEAGLDPRIVTGAELASCPPQDLPDLAEHTDVFARVSPEQKLRLVETLQARGHVVAMTGDGINDAPALRRADIGVAMGVGGTEVAKEASDMVLTDDDFASIEAAVEEGRGVFDNLRKFITFILPTSMGQGLIILAAISVGSFMKCLAQVSSTLEPDVSKKWVLRTAVGYTVVTTMPYSESSARRVEESESSAALVAA
jgi:magnesium-transporting ATPase (P-type)